MAVVRDQDARAVEHDVGSASLRDRVAPRRDVVGLRVKRPVAESTAFASRPGVAGRGGHDDLTGPEHQ